MISKLLLITNYSSKDFIPYCKMVYGVLRKNKDKIQKHIELQPFIFQQLSDYQTVIDNELKISLFGDLLLLSTLYFNVIDEMVQFTKSLSNSLNSSGSVNNEYSYLFKTISGYTDLALREERTEIAPFCSLISVYEKLIIDFETYLIVTKTFCPSFFRFYKKMNSALNSLQRPIVAASIKKILKRTSKKEQKPLLTMCSFDDILSFCYFSEPDILACSISSVNKHLFHNFKFPIQSLYNIIKSGEMTIWRENETIEKKYYAILTTDGLHLYEVMNTNNLKYKRDESNSTIERLYPYKHLNLL